jgi:MYXO-CTERM domain-containing protein
MRPVRCFRPVLVACSVLACSSRTVDNTADASAPSVASIERNADVVIERRALRPIGARFARGGQITLAGASWSTTLHTTAFGRGDRLERVTSGERRVVGERIEYAHETFVEWYAPDPHGIEQGFTIAAPPAGSGRVEVEIAFEGVTPVRRGETVALGESARIEGLSVVDARGTKLPAELEVVDGRLRIRTDDRGATYPITIDPLYTPSEGKLLGTDLGASTWFGRSVAISGDTAVVGGAKEFFPWSAGVAYVFTRSGSTWTQQAKLLPMLEPDDRFGWSVAIDGDTLAIGSPAYNAGSTTAGGGVFVYTRSGITWSLQATLSHTDAVASDGFGASVALVGDRLLVGAPWKTYNSGAAYLFTRSGTSWSQTKKFSGTVNNDYFGETVAIGDNYLAIGSPRNDTTAFNAGMVSIIQAGSLDPWVDLFPDAIVDGNFGSALAARGDHLVIGAPGAATAQAYVFVHSTSSWGLPIRKLAGAYSFGSSVAMNDTMVAVGERFFNFTGMSGAGRVHVYSRGVWTDDTILSLSDRAAQDEFGSSVALTNDTLVVGAAGRDDKGTDSGAAYVWRVAAEKIKGATCSVNDECASKSCVDGVCCTTLCTGRCESCSAARKASGVDGDCGPTKDGLVDTGDCSATSCAGDGVINKAQVCNGASVCRADGTISCAPYGCSGSTCLTTCSSDTECATSAFCEASTCKTDLDAGATCARAAQCKSGYCVDGLCCDRSCNAKCEACSAAKKGSGINGKCDPVAADSDPDDDCAAATGDACGLPGTCDGIGACRLYAKSGTVCGATSCVDGKVAGKVCNGAGACGDSTGVACGAYACVGAACTTTCTDATATTDCAANAYCTSTTTCATKKANGTACTASKECSSSFCVDGVCCSSTCTGQCESCNESGTEGACVPVTGEPRGKRPKCAGDPAVCGGTCDGIDAARCKYAASSKDCGSKCESATASNQKCDGSGECLTTTQSCAPFGCDATGCRTTCATDTDCATGNRCAAPSCVPITSGAKCIDPLTSQDSSGKNTPCSPYKCDSDGACKKICTDSAGDCAPGFLCNATTKTCDPPAAVTDEGGGCGCETGVGRASSGGLFALLMLSAVVARRRR